MVRRAAGVPPPDYSTLRGALHPWSWELNADNDLSALSDLSVVSSGLVSLGGVRFDVRGVVLMRRLEKAGGPWQGMWDRYPTNVSGIRIDQKWRRLHVQLTTYDNPRPDIEVTSIDLVSKMTTAAPFLVAMTVEP